MERTRVMALDLGSVRIGVAVAAAGVATPLCTLKRTKDRQGLHREIRNLVDEWEVAHVIVGLPLSLSGRRGPAAQNAETEIAELRATLGVPVEAYDERFSTVSADRSLKATSMNGQARRGVIDQVAAAVMLQAWLDSQTAANDAAGAELAAPEPGS